MKYKEVKQEETTLVTKDTYINFIRHSRDYPSAGILLILYCIEQLLIISLTKYIGYWAQLQATFILSQGLSYNVQEFDNTMYILIIVILTMGICVVHYVKTLMTINFPA